MSEMQLFHRIRDRVRGSASIKRSRHIIGEHRHTMVRRKGTFRAGSNPLTANFFDMLGAYLAGLAGGLTAGTACHVAFGHGGKTAARKRAVIVRRFRSKDTVYQIITVYMIIMLRNDSVSNAGGIRLTLSTGDADSLSNIIIRSDLSVKAAGGQSLAPKAGGRIAAAAFDSRADGLHGLT